MAQRGLDESAARTVFSLSSNHTHHATAFISNYVSTAKYTLVTFLPKNLFEQFRRLANVYFLFISALQIFTDLSPTGRYTTLIPLCLVLAVTASKEAFEDWKRHRADREVNARLTEVLVRPGEVNGEKTEESVRFAEKMWKDLKVGDVVRVKNREFIPADLVLLCSSEPLGIAYVETSNLDGETNLKIHQAHPDTADAFPDLTTSIATYDIAIECDAPNNSLYTFQGAIVDFNQDGKRIPLGPKQVLLRGSTLRNTAWAIGVAVYTGHEAKVMLNANETRSKESKVAKKINRQILYTFCLLVFFCVFSAIGRGIWARHVGLDMDYLYENENTTGAAFESLGTFLILYNNLIPISLYVSIELVKVIQAALINWDIDMYDPHSDTPALARTSNLNEELGQIEYVFSDKTGTLTQNLMEFRKCTIAGVSYGTDFEIPVPERAKRGLPVNFNFTDDRFLNHLQGKDLGSSPDPKLPPKPELIKLFLEMLSVCHTVIPEIDSSNPNEIIYQASSPDESALVCAGKQFGYAFRARTPRTVTVSVNGVDAVYEILNILEFNSTRKRMSVIIRTPDKRIMLMCKGADSVIYERLAPGCSFANATLEQLESFAVIGLRTLCFAYKYVNESDYIDWNIGFQTAAASLVDRAKKLDDCAETIEKNLMLVGATAIEDKLQLGVPDAIATLMRAGIKVWVLTGDKQETAINIGFSARLLTPDMELMTINTENPDDVVPIIEAHLNNTLLNGDYSNPSPAPNSKGSSSSSPSSPSAPSSSNGNNNNSASAQPRKDPKRLATVVDGYTLRMILEDTAISKKFLDLATRCSAVICCRVSPLQKALVVSLVKDNLGAISLAIGDGANDVSMIQAAHVGVGISGQEGLQAARSADYSIAQFRFLLKLLLVHGRWSYRRISKLICYSFYKNFALYLTQFWYIFFNGYSGQTMYDGWTLACYNVFFANFPILVYAVTDQDVSAQMSLDYPALYELGQQNKFFNTRIFWQWCFNAIFHSLILFLVPMGMMSHGNFMPGGQDSGLWLQGVIMFTTVVTTVNLKVSFEVNYWTKIMGSSIFISLLLLILFYLPYHTIGVTSLDLGNDMYWIIYRCFSVPHFYFCVILVTVLACLRDYIWKALKRQMYPELYHIVQEHALLRKSNKVGPEDAPLPVLVPKKPSAGAIILQPSPSMRLNDNGGSTPSLGTSKTTSASNLHPGKGPADSTGNMMVQEVMSSSNTDTMTASHSSLPGVEPAARPSQPPPQQPAQHIQIYGASTSSASTQLSPAQIARMGHPPHLLKSAALASVFTHNPHVVAASHRGFSFDQSTGQEEMLMNNQLFLPRSNTLDGLARVATE